MLSIYYLLCNDEAITSNITCTSAKDDILKTHGKKVG
jgi:hypothetical protein